MAHKYEHVSTGLGFSVLNGTTKTAVINQDGTLNGSAVIDDGSVTPVKLGGARIASVQQTVTFSEFTDGGAAVGTLELDTDIPLGAVVTQTLIDDVTGFAGDTSAVITIGDGTDVDRYNTGTPDVFTTAAAISAGAASGTAFHSAAKTPTLTITTATDWGLVTAGALTVTIFYYVDA